MIDGLEASMIASLLIPSRKMSLKSSTDQITRDKHYSLLKKPLNAS
jgi:hypothetical protein